MSLLFSTSASGSVPCFFGPIRRLSSLSLLLPLLLLAFRPVGQLAKRDSSKWQAQICEPKSLATDSLLPLGGILSKEVSQIKAATAAPEQVPLWSPFVFRFFFRLFVCLPVCLSVCLCVSLASWLAGWRAVEDKPRGTQLETGAGRHRATETRQKRAHGRARPVWLTRFIARCWPPKLVTK